MANFNDVLTTEGQRFLMKMISGEIGPIKFTRVVLGDGNTSDNLTNIKQMVNPICESAIESVTISSKNDVTITSVFTNEHITEGFYMREKGIYASDGTTEVLILYANSGSQAQWIKPAAADIYEKVMRSIILFSQSDNVNIELKNDGYANVIDFEKHIENNFIHITDDERQTWNKHIEDKNNPHNVTKAQVGLGNVPNVTTNDQTPTYTEADRLENITSGEKASISFGKIKKAISTLISHIVQIGTASVLGHVKLSDTYASKIAAGAAANGLGASQNALYNAYITLVNNLNGKANSAHYHDDRYYTEGEMNNFLNGKANTVHYHDDRYYTEGEMNNFLNGKANTSHSHDSIGSGNFWVATATTDGAGCFRPTIDTGSGKLNLGTASYKWRNIYATNGTIQTSDRNEKIDIKELENEKILKFFMMLKPCSFKMIDGDSGRTHFGFIAQDVEEAMNNAGMSSFDFAGFIKFQKYKICLDENNNEYEEPTGDYGYGLRYEEFIALLSKVVQHHEQLFVKMTECIEKMEKAKLI